MISATGSAKRTPKSPFFVKFGSININGTKITPNSDKVVLKAKYKNKVIDEYAYIAPSNNNIEP